MDLHSSSPLSAPFPFGSSSAGASSPRRASVRADAQTEARLRFEQASGVGLSTKGANPSPPPIKRGPTPFRPRRKRHFWLRAGHRGLVFDIHKSLALCGLGQKGWGGDPDEAQVSPLVCEPAGDGQEARAAIKGLYKCASAASCPVCAPKIATGRGEILGPQVRELIGKGYRAYLVTLTVRHERTDALAVLQDALSRGWARMTSGKGWKNLTKSGAISYIKGLDLTWSQAHGWHPHVHITLLVPPTYEDARGFANAFRDRWMSSLEKVGFEALPGGQDVQECRDVEKSVRYAVTPAAVKETLGSSMKTGRPNKGLSAFDVLERAVEGDAGFQARWCEYVEAMKGRRTITVSRDLSLAEDDELMPEETGIPIADLGNETVRELDRTNRTVELLEAVEDASAVSVEAMKTVAWAILGSLVSRDWTIHARPPADPPPDLQPSSRPLRQVHWRLVPPTR